MAQPKRIHPFLWFDGQAGQAADFYLGLFRNSRLLRTQRWAMDTPGAKKGDVLAVDFELEGERFTALNGGPNFQFTPAVSFLVDCDDQAEIDRLWDGLLSGGGRPMQCGWLVDRFGVTWQVVPGVLREWMMDPDEEKARRTSLAMMAMVKLDIEALRRAHDGD